MYLPKNFSTLIGFFTIMPAVVVIAGNSINTGFKYNGDSGSLSRRNLIRIGQREHVNTNLQNEDSPFAMRIIEDSYSMDTHFGKDVLDVEGTRAPSWSEATQPTFPKETPKSPEGSLPPTPNPISFHAKTITPTHTYSPSIPNIVFQEPSVTAKILVDAQAAPNPLALHAKTMSPSVTAIPSPSPFFEELPAIVKTLVLPTNPASTPGPGPIATSPSILPSGCEENIPCKSRPALMVMRFIEGNCATSMNSQRQGFFICQDFDSSKSQVHIVVKDILGRNITFFKGNVELNQDFLLWNEGRVVEPNLNVTIYSSNNSATQKILQTMVFHTSCSENLFVNDIFGSILLVGFASNVQNSFEDCRDFLTTDIPSPAPSLDPSILTMVPTNTVMPAGLKSSSSQPSVTLSSASVGPPAVVSNAPNDEICGSTIRCEERPVQIFMRFIGGSCLDSINVQNPGLFFCQDFASTKKQNQVDIVVSDVRGKNITYFDGTVNLDGHFALGNEEGQVEPNINITLYASTNSTSPVLLQTMVFHTSCSENLFSNDIFGSVQLLGFVNSIQNISGDCLRDIPSSNPSEHPSNDLTVTSTPSASLCGSRIRCEKRPTEMIMQFIGGNCSNSANIQSQDLFFCEDYGSMEEARQVHIFVSDIRGASIIYFNETVNFNQNFILSDGVEEVVANMNMTIYSSDGFATLLQTMVFHTSCSQNLFSNDIFGGVQLVGFRNSLQNVNDGCTVEPSIAPSDKISPFPSTRTSSSPSSETKSFSEPPTLLTSEIPTLYRPFSPSNDQPASPSASPSSEVESIMPTRYLISEDPNDTPFYNVPSKIPTKIPSSVPSQFFSTLPSIQPSHESSSVTPTPTGSAIPSQFILDNPSVTNSDDPSFVPSSDPTSNSNLGPSLTPSIESSTTPTSVFSNTPSLLLISGNPTTAPSDAPSFVPSRETPSSFPSLKPSDEPSAILENPTTKYSENPSYVVSPAPTKIPAFHPSSIPSIIPTFNDSATPSNLPSSTKNQSLSPTRQNLDAPSDLPTFTPSSMELITTPVPSPNCPCAIEVDAPFYECGDPITVHFSLEDARKSDWIGIFPCHVDTFRQAIVWQWSSCTSSRCKKRQRRRSGTVSFDQSCNPNWPVAPYYRQKDTTISRCFKAAYLRDDGSAPYPAVCESKEFLIMENDSQGCQIH